jgi:hemolysin III
MQEFSRPHVRERTADAIVHFCGLATAPIGCAALFVAAKNPLAPRPAAAILLYAAGLVAMITCSALYNLYREGGPWKTCLRRLDHAAIFIMIAGTYTPIALLGIGGTWGWTMLGLVWAGAGAGILFKCYAPLDREPASLIAYLGLGWVGLLALEPLLTLLSTEDLSWLLAGGLLYSLGTIVHLSPRLPYHNAIWHAVVLLAAGCHYAVVFHLAAG